MDAEILSSSFERLRRLSPRALAILDMDADRSFSRDEISALADRLAPLACKAASGSRVVAIQAPNSPELVAVILAAWREGLIPLPVDRERSEGETLAIAGALGCEQFLRGKSMESVPVDKPVAAVLPADTGVLKLTSGSTGEPRAVAVTRRALESGVTQICTTMGIEARDRNLTTLPLAHSYAFDNVLGPLALLGTPAVLLSDLVPRRLARVLRDTGVTVWPAVPMLLDLLSRSKLGAENLAGSLRLVISAGAPLPLSIREAFAQRFGVRPRTFYGATECGGIAFDRQGLGDVPDGCVGRPLDGVEVELQDVDEGVGRILVRSSSTAIGSFPQPSAEIESGAVLTPDLGRFDTLGRLHLLGRVGEFVKIQGHKVYPLEVERVVRSVPGVLDVAVVPRARSSVSEGLRAVVAAVRGVKRQDILDACEKLLPAHKIPRSVEIRSVLPRNERGKIDRKRL